jgi:nucleoside-diphosphate-sugar epimerase
MSFWHQRSVLITGGAGFIGSHLARRLVNLGARVRIADDLSRGRLENIAEIIASVEFIRCDLSDPASALNVCDSIEVVFHLASRVGGIGYYVSRPAEVLVRNILIDALMLRAALICGADRYIYASSAHVYPKHLQMTPDAPRMKEEQAVPASPGLSYGWGKLVGEKELEYTVAEGSLLRVAILRLVGVYGENQDRDLTTGSAIPVFIRQAIEYPARKPFVILGTGEETRSYCYVEDVINAMLIAAEKLSDERIVGPLNVGSNERISIRNLAETIIAISGKPIIPVYNPSHPTTIWGQALDCSQARQRLNGWYPKIPLREGLRRVYEHMLSKLSREGEGTA